MCQIRASSEDVTLLRCGRCEQTFYCSKHCQKTHWHLHKTDCFTPEERKQIKTVTRQTTLKACERCSKTKVSTGKSLRRCSRCMRVHYCSVECQTKDWARHKTSCVEGGQKKMYLIPLKWIVWMRVSKCCVAHVPETGLVRPLSIVTLVEPTISWA